MESIINPIERNLKGIEYEKQGNIKCAIELYEQNIKDRFDGNHPYDRLVKIYKYMNKLEEAKRVLEIAIDVFENDINKERKDRIPKLNKFKNKLSQIEKIIRSG